MLLQRVELHRHRDFFDGDVGQSARSAAARELGVEHTTVGRRVAAFEKELGVTLFYRTASGYWLIPQGEAMIAGAEAI